MTIVRVMLARPKSLPVMVGAFELGKVPAVEEVIELPSEPEEPPHRLRVLATSEVPQNFNSLFAHYEHWIICREEQQPEVRAGL